MDDVIVKAPAGSFRGIEKHGVFSFRGIPYAATTAGEGRWRAPRPVDLGPGVHDATEFGPSAPQNAAGLEAMLGQGEGTHSEDCLRLNVLAPVAGWGDRLPVMVWIHGGSFETGAGHIPWYNGTALARRGVVVVTINYRLGALGYLHLGGVGLGDDFPDAGNLGVLDQVAALRWVRDNIEAFGGDPGNVTLFGESAGAMSIGVLLGVEAAKGLFHKAILQSGAAGNLHEPARAASVADQFLAAAGSGADPAKLMALSVEEVLAAQAKVAIAGADLALPWQPVIDGLHIPDPPLAKVSAGASSEVALLIGTTLEEMRLFQLMMPEMRDLDEAKLRRSLSRIFGQGSDSHAERAIRTYRERLGADAGAADVWMAAATDHVFRMPAIRLASSHAAHQGDVRMYLFTYRSPAFGGVLGSSHAMEIPFVFDILDAGGVAMFVGPVEDRHRKLATMMGDAWVAFARDGAPAAEGLPAWPRYDEGRRATMKLDVDTCEVLDDPMREERLLWFD